MDFGRAGRLEVQVNRFTGFAHLNFSPEL